jgi:NAD(P)H-dependent FMN reductase
MRIVIVSTSLNGASKSRLLAQYVSEKLHSKSIDATFVDLRDYQLPLCDGGAVYADPQVKAVSAILSSADAVILTVPIYNYNVSAAAKNLLEVTGYALKGKLVAVITAAGGSRGFMGVLPFVNSMQIDFGAWIVPTFISARETSFADGKIIDSDLCQRLDELLELMLSFKLEAR